MPSLNLVRCSALAATLGLLAAPAQATLIPVNDDLWDVSQGASVTAHSGVLTDPNPFFVSDIRNMFGHVLTGTVEPANTLFRDGQPAGTLHWVEWQTAIDITLRSFALFAAHDGEPEDANARGFSRFTLYGFNPATNVFDIELFELFPSNPYGDTPSPPQGVSDSSNHILRIAANVAPTTTDRFRAEFVQFGFAAANRSGPRIIELDGFDTFHPAVPLQRVAEPRAVALLGIALSGALLLPGLRRRTPTRA
jgi:hypothetical protein